jgi:23S rRNA (adenine2503-C2)-methyltransferase
MMKSGESKRDIRSLDRDSLYQYFESIGEKKFRAKQVEEWLWQKSVKDFDQMTNISLDTRRLLNTHFYIKDLQVDHLQRSSDGTIKNAVKLHDGLVVESVLIPTDTRITACISSQVGCSLDCHFCATARLKRMRNLTADEIYDQVVVIREQARTYFDRPLTNIVFMGMGEPLLNYPQVMLAIEKITGKEGLGMAARRITVSTVGIPKMILKMADEKPRFNLAVSLHSAIESVRSTIMPINEKSRISQLIPALQHWYDQTKRRITFEYVVWKGINDGEEDALALARLCRKVPCKVNLIQYNPIGEGRFQQADSSAIERYMSILGEEKIVARIRESRGQDIDAACGQLANKKATVNE